MIVAFQGVRQAPLGAWAGYPFTWSISLQGGGRLDPEGGPIAVHGTRIAFMGRRFPLANGQPRGAGSLSRGGE